MAYEYLTSARTHLLSSFFSTASEFGCPSEAAYSLTQAHVSEHSLGLIHVEFHSVRHFNVFSWRTLRIRNCHYSEAKEGHIWTNYERLELLLPTADISVPHAMAQQPPVGQGLLIIEPWRSHSDTLHSVGLLWASDQPDAETSTWQHSQHTSMPPTGFKP